MPVRAEGEPFIRAVEPLTEMTPERGAAQRESAPRAEAPEPLPPLCLRPVEPGDRGRLALFVGGEIDLDEVYRTDGREWRAPGHSRFRRQGRVPRAGRGSRGNCPRAVMKSRYGANAASTPSAVRP